MHILPFFDWQIMWFIMRSLLPLHSSEQSPFSHKVFVKFLSVLAQAFILPQRYVQHVYTTVIHTCPKEKIQGFHISSLIANPDILATQVSLRMAVPV